MINAIYKRGRIWWWKYRPHGTHGRIRFTSLKTTDRRVAEKKQAELAAESQQEAAGIIAPKPLRDAAQRKLSDHLQDYLADVVARRRSEKHIDNIRHRVGVLIDECRWDVTRDVTADSFQEWRQQQRLSAKTLNDYLEAARCFLNWMVRHGRLVANPLSAVEKVKTVGRETRVRRAFTEEEMRRLIGFVPNDRRAIYLTAVYTGLRHSELRGLQWGDICLDAPNPFVRVRAATTKNGKPVVMCLHDDVVKALRVLRLPDAAPVEPVFPHMPRIERFRRDLKKAGIAYVDERGRVGDFHSLRKTFCTNLARAGVASRVAMSLMRHSDRRLTDEVYTDENLLGTGKAIEALPSYTTGLSHRLSQISDAGGHGVARRVAGNNGDDVEETPVNIDESRDLAPSGASGREGQNGGSDGARTRNLCRDRAAL